MEKGTFKVTLADGTQLTDLALNGNNFISKTELTEATFEGKLRHVVIEGDAEADMYGLIGEHENMALVQVQQYGAEWWFILRGLSPAELQELKNRGDIEYLAMMTGVEL